MDENKEYDYIKKRLNQSIGGGNISEMWLQILPHNKKEPVKICISLEVIKRMPLHDIDKAQKIYNRIQRFHYELEDIIK